MLASFDAVLCVILASGGFNASDEQAEAEYPLFAHGLDVIGDVDGDGTSDLAVTNSACDAVWIVSTKHSRVLLAARIECERYGFPVVQRAGDVDDDGVPDLATRGGRGESLTIVSSRTGARLRSVRGSLLLPLSDRDGDGREELCILSRQELRIEGSRTFASHWSVQSSTPVGRISLEPAGDVDGDGMSDLVVVAEERVRIRSGRDGRVLFERGILEKFPPARAIISGDLDSDGSADLVVSYPERSCAASTSSRLRIFSPAKNAELAVLTAAEVAGDAEVLGDDLARLGDVDGDGMNDFAVASHGWLHDEVRVISGRTRKHLHRFDPEGLESECHRRYVVRALADIDGDHVDELVIGASPYPMAGRCYEGYVQVRSGKTGEVLRRFDERALRSRGIPTPSSGEASPR